MKEDLLITKDYSKIIDLLGTDFKTTRDLTTTRDKIIRLIQKELPYVTKEYLSQAFSLIANSLLPDDMKSIKKIELVPYMLGSLGEALLERDLPDHGYSILVMYFVWLVSKESK